MSWKCGVAIVLLWVGTAHAQEDALKRADELVHSEIRCPMLIEFGDADPVAPIEEINRLAEAFSDAEHVQVRVYPGAGHGFSHTGWDDHDAAAMAEARPGLEKMLSALRV